MKKQARLLHFQVQKHFFLCNLLSNSKITHENFTTKYFKDYDTDSDIHRIETDGRYFKIITHNKSSYTLDLGFNFIEKNELSKRLQLKTKYD